MTFWSGVRPRKAVSATESGTPWRTASLRMFCRQDWKSVCAEAGKAKSADVAAMRVSFMKGDMPVSLSRAGDRHPFNSYRRRVGRALELQVVRGRHRQEHVLEVPGDGDAAHRIGELAVLDPEARGAAAVVAGDAVHAGADHVGDEEPALDVADQLADRVLALLEIEVRGRGTGRARGAARGVARGLEVELARGREVEQPCRQHTVVDHRHARAGQALGVERPAAEPALAMRVVEDADAVGEDLGAHLVLEERRA